MTVEIHKTRALQQESANPTSSAWVEASAGTGKTKVLTDRMLRLLLAGAPAANILCLTFTRSAAAEMKDRLRERLLSWSKMPDDCLNQDLKTLSNELGNPKDRSKARQLYDQLFLIEQQPQFHTIHSFCELLLRRFADEAGVDGSFTVLDEDDFSNLLNSARDRVLEKIETSSNTTLKNAIKCVSTYTQSEGFSDLLAFLIARKSRLESLPSGNNSCTIANALRKKLELDDETSRIGTLKLACASSSIDTEGLHSSIKKLQKGTKTDKKKAKIMLEWLTATQDQRRADFDKYCAVFITRNHQPVKRLVSTAVASDYPAIRSLLETEQRRLLEIKMILKRTQIIECTTALLELTTQVAMQLEGDKTFHNCLNYDDLIIKARKALQSHGMSSWLLYMLDNSIDHILIDEAQDTNSEQWEIITALVSEFFAGASSRSQQRTIFVVGDYKQSIYSFQQAEPDAFRKMHQYFRRRATSISAPWSDINLQLSFRSTLPILQAVDLVFPSDSSIYYGLEKKLDNETKHYCYRGQASGLVELWPVIKPKEKRVRPEWKPPICIYGKQSSRAQLAYRVATKIASLLASKENCNGKRLQPGDILVLVRRRGEFVTDLIRELKLLHIPVAGMDRLILTDSIAVMDLISLAHFLLNTDDDLSLAEVLKSPLCNFDDNDLFDIAYNRDNSLWTSLCQLALRHTQFEKAKCLLNTLLEKTRTLTPYELFADLLMTQGAMELFVSRIGRDSIEPLEEFLNKAIQYESKHSPSLQGFIDWVENNRSIVRRDTSLANEKAVRILTVHGAKGLEAPVVFLPDTVQKSHKSLNIIWPSSDTYPLWIPNANLLDKLTEELSSQKKKKDQEEYERLLYVAMTRAKDQLYICGWSETPNTPDDCWHSAVSLALREKADRFSQIFPNRDQTNESIDVLRLANFSQNGTEKANSPPSPWHPEPLPEWAAQKRLKSSNPGSFPYPHQTINVFSPSHLTETRAGKLIAHLVDFMADIKVVSRESFAEDFVAGLSQEVGQSLRETIKESALKICASPSLNFLFEAEAQGCLPISGEVKNGDQVSLVYSSIDRLIVKDGMVTVVSFQAGNQGLKDLAKIPNGILEEIAINGLLARAVYPKKHITSAILWTEEQKLQPISDKILGKRLS